MFHIVGDKLNECPRSEQAAMDRLFARAIAVLARTYVLLKTLGISFITSLGGYYQTVFCQTPTALPVKKQKFCACLFTTSRKMHELCFVASASLST